MCPGKTQVEAKEQLGPIPKKENGYLRRMLMLGATAQLRGKCREKAVGGVWFEALLRRKPAKVAAVALANKMARVAWAVLTKDEVYQPSRTETHSVTV